MKSSVADRGGLQSWVIAEENKLTARVLLLLSALTLLAATDWPDWRGPHRDGVVAEEPKTWPEKLSLKGKTEVGIGHASPVMASGSIYSFARQGNDKRFSPSILRMAKSVGSSNMPRRTR